MDQDFLIDGPADAAVTILLAHGAGAPMDSASMNSATAALVAVGFRVARFEFGYMAARRSSETRKPPPKAEKLIPEYMAAVARLGASGPLIIGGKSMGGRVASMVADDLLSQDAIAGLLCLGYPFHPPGKPENLRTQHLAGLKTPTLICQGTRDEFGTREEVAGYALSGNIRILWLEDGDHDLKPRKTVSGFSAAGHMKSMAGTMMAWSQEITQTV
ncbi:alpha/beta family hydrolase [Pararhizobium sp. DWP3-4]|uniref:alpha/beta hydrolase family protein n=1 Tax=Pararhizobium sp. DWP3-4 TaxID=2804565 RepID=UPI003CEDDABE